MVHGEGGDAAASSWDRDVVAACGDDETLLLSARGATASDVRAVLARLRVAAGPERPDVAALGRSAAKPVEEVSTAPPSGPAPAGQNVSRDDATGLEALAGRAAGSGAAWESKFVQRRHVRLVRREVVRPHLEMGTEEDHSSKNQPERPRLDGDREVSSFVGTPHPSQPLVDVHTGRASKTWPWTC